MAIPSVITVSLPQGDSLTLSLPVTDDATRQPINLPDYDGAWFALTPLADESAPDPAAVLTKQLGDGVTFRPGGVVEVTLATGDTQELLPGHYVLPVRLGQGGAVRHTLRPVHRLLITPAPF